MIVRLKLSALMNLISSHLVPGCIAEHVFFHKDQIADSMQKGEAYSFKTPTGETIEIRMDENV